MAGTLYIVATPIGNVADFSERAIKVLQQVAVIAVEDTRHSGRLLQAHSINTPMLSCHEHNETERSEQLLKRVANGEDVALISDAGTPLVSDPGFHLVRMAHQRGCKVVPIPGPSAVIAALSCAGLPTDRFVFEGFLPAKQGARLARLQELQNDPRTLVFYEAPHRIEECLQDMVAVMGAERPATLARELTKTFETIIPATLGELHAKVQADENQRKGEFVLVVAGAQRSDAILDSETEKTLKILMSELPLRQAAALAAKITGQKKNLLYNTALAWQQIKD
ncbi:MAG: 16S rRNA (cytidine(1402)-2'-O)-methyltransferase [Gammaproteobacteria bacterium]